MTEQQLQEIKDRLNKTTDTIWRTNMHNEILTSNGVRLGQMIRVQDAEFVIYAREDVPALIEEVERLRGALETIREVELERVPKYEAVEMKRIASEVLEGEKL